MRKELKNITDMKDFEPEEEAFLGKWAKQQYGSDFLFVTHYLSKTRDLVSLWTTPKTPKSPFRSTCCSAE